MAGSGIRKCRDDMIGEGREPFSPGRCVVSIICKTPETASSMYSLAGTRTETEKRLLRT